MEIFVIIGAGLIFVSILLSPLAVRTGAPLLLFFLAILPVISPGPLTVELFNQVFVTVIASLILQGWTIPFAGRVFGVEIKPDETDSGLP
jgi:cell volume regulation protein A